MDKRRKSAGNLYERAYFAIRDRILSGDFPIGSPLSRRNLAADLGMSALPVSEALRRLESEGLVESRPRVGTRVRIPTAQDVRDRYIIREALESQSARLFAEKASPGEKEEVSKMAVHLDAMMDAYADEESNPDQLLRAQSYHLAFHMRIAECTGSPGLCDAIEKNRILFFNWLFDVVGKIHNPPRWHQELMDALVGPDPLEADAAMRRHIRHGLDEIQEVITSRFAVESPLASPWKGRPPYPEEDKTVGWS
jgi:GntR family transcriptional regulator, rspAB operon transcriptional repressor